MHTNAADATRPAVHRSLFSPSHRRGGRARQDECTTHAARPVYLMPCSVPNLRDALPLVHNVGTRAQEHHRWVCPCQVKALVNIGHRGPVLECRPCLAAPLGACDFDRTEHFEVPLDLLVDHARHVSCRLLEFIGHPVLPPSFCERVYCIRILLSFKFGFS